MHKYRIISRELPKALFPNACIHFQCYTVATLLLVCVAYAVYLLKRSRCKGLLSSIWCRVLSGLDPWRVAGAPL